MVVRGTAVGGQKVRSWPARSFPEYRKEENKSIRPRSQGKQDQEFSVMGATSFWISKPEMYKFTHGFFLS